MFTISAPKFGSMSSFSRQIFAISSGLPDASALMVCSSTPMVSDTLKICAFNGTIVSWIMSVDRDVFANVVVSPVTNALRTFSDIGMPNNSKSNFDKFSCSSFLITSVRDLFVSASSFFKEEALAAIKVKTATTVDAKGNICVGFTIAPRTNHSNTNVV